jgi:hypothetical protein
MKRQDRRGQIDISFGMIVSIIIVIATVAIGFYVITYFLDLSSCTKVGSFWKSMDDDVNKAWNSVMTETSINLNLPSGIAYACLGNETPSSANDQLIFSGLRVPTYSAGTNVFLYPAGKACGLASKKLEHVKIGNFFCIPVKSGVVSIRLSKGISDQLVTLSKS